MNELTQELLVILAGFVAIVLTILLVMWWAARSHQMDGEE